jgi:phage-related protein
LNTLEGKLKGQAAASADTAAGKLKVMKQELIDAGGNIVTTFMPAVTALTGVIATLASRMDIFGPILAGVVGGFVAWKAVNMASEIATYISKIATLIPFLGAQAAAQGEVATTAEAADVAMSANPIGAIVMAISVLVVAIVLLVTHLKQVGDFFRTVFTSISNFFSQGPWKVLADVISAPFKIAVGIITGIVNVVIGIVKGIIAFVQSPVFQFLAELFTLPFKVAAAVILTLVGIVIKIVEGLVAFFQSGAFHTLSDIISAPFKIAFGIIGGLIGGVVGIFNGIKDGVAHAASAIAGVISAPFKAAFNAIAWLWNHTLGLIHFTVPGWVPFIGGKDIGFPQMPTLHAGGVVPGTPGTEVAVLAQAGEGVISRADMQRGGGSGDTYNVNVNVASQADPWQIGREVVWGLRTQARRV